jgi:hypothetical protein
VGDLAFVTQIEPAACEHSLAFELVDLAVGDITAVDESDLGVDERFDIHALLLPIGAFLLAAYQDHSELSSELYRTACLRPES